MQLLPLGAAVRGELVTYYHAHRAAEQYFLCVDSISHNHFTSTPVGDGLSRLREVMHRLMYSITKRRSLDGLGIAAHK